MCHNNEAASITSVLAPPLEVAVPGAYLSGLARTLRQVTEATTGTLIAERYRLEQQVGEGGMGSVWVAEDEKLERWVAVKLLGKGVAASRTVRERFEREAMAIAKLRSPHVVQIFDYGTAAEGAAFIVMELLSGQDLFSWLRDNRSVSLGTVASIVTQVAKALSAAHRASIIHRDLKPGNIFVVHDHEEEIVKVFDFGLAKGLSELSPLRELEDRTGEGVLLGTPRYMSPEQAHGAREVDHRSDLWSLGVIAYLAVTGRLPFEGSGVGQVITKISTQHPPPPSSLVSGLPSEVDGFFECALAKLPDDRFQTAMALAEAFEAACDGGRTSQRMAVGRGHDTFVDAKDTDTQISDVTGDDPTLAEAPISGESLLEASPSSPLLRGSSDDAWASLEVSGADGSGIGKLPFDLVDDETTPPITVRQPPWLAAGLALALVATVLWALSGDSDTMTPATRGAAPVVVLEQQPTVSVRPEPTAEPAPTQSSARPATPRSREVEHPDPKHPDPKHPDPKHPDPQHTDPEPSAQPVSDSGLELFDDRH